MQPILLPHFQFNASRIGEQMEALLNAIYECGRTHDIAEVHLLTPEVRRESRGRVAVSEARTVRIFSRDEMDNSYLKRSQHHWANNLTITECKGILRLTAGELSGSAIYDMHLLPPRDSDVCPAEIIVLKSSHAKNVTALLHTALLHTVEAASAKAPDNVVMSKLYVVPNSLTQELSSILDQIGPVRAEPPAKIRRMRTAHA